ncbi:hypothetical protein GUITHDRAFT_116641 [Guillardia theta CCMP2712]|uniref:NHR domain-containing protein n=1 Tax=Guillardia theta (strain CCMP2712) TaxID=905079 RepID=L1ILU3_GUITC|nr:hypothetical protein GUITHDRAFT_116641 [Guillardia theta CCMP2712]EKX37226.1 hypothetical protein GUITHDRAFT_116641 [Guillardia theta CCMP2712]|eukprot:XP_005824206.1 hypothetical protein GUITHDRAFT_116641 [Guillardia theta CCMP2712]
MPGDRKFGLGKLNTADEIRVIRDGPRLSFLINGRQQGLAFDDLPPNVYACIGLYGQCLGAKIVGQGALP